MLKYIFYVIFFHQRIFQFLYYSGIYLFYNILLQIKKLVFQDKIR